MAGLGTGFVQLNSNGFEIRMNASRMAYHSASLCYVVSKHVIDFCKEPILLQNVCLIITGQFTLRIYCSYSQPVITHQIPSNKPRV